MIDRPVPGVVRVWLVDLDAPFDDSCLDAAERARAATIKRPDAARRWAASRAALRALLGSSTGLAPAQVALAPAGPQAPVGGLHVSISHSYSVAAIALALEPVGVDLERDRPLEQPELLAARLGPAALNRVRAAAPEGRSAAFLREWTRHEASLKLAAGDPWLSDLQIPDATGALAAHQPLTPVVCGWR